MLRTRPSAPVSAIALLLACSTSAGATILYLGLPDGRALAWTTRDGRLPWLRVAAADLPAVTSYAAPALADLDGDGVPDALVAAGDGRFVALRNAGDAAAPRWVEEPSWRPPAVKGGAPALADLDGDGDPDLLIGQPDGDVLGFENVGTPRAPAWRRRDGWRVGTGMRRPRPALGDADGDGVVDLAVGTEAGPVLVYAGPPPFRRAPGWDAPDRITRGSPALADLDGDGRADLLVTDGQARSRAYRNTGSGWEERRAWAPDDPGSGPAGPALVAGELRVEPPPASASGDPVARLMASTLTGTAPLRVTLDASASTTRLGVPLTFAWDFGDGTPPPSPAPAADPATALLAGREGYDAAKATRDAGRWEEAVGAYVDTALALIPLTVVERRGPITVHGTDRIDRVARWYLQKIAHDLGAIYLFRDVGGATGCARHALSLQWSREAVSQAIAGGFPALPASNGTTGNLDGARRRLDEAGCDVPAPASMLPAPGAVPGTGAVVEHVYAGAGRYRARVTVSANGRTASASVTVVVTDHAGPPDADGPADNDADPLEGFGASTRGGEGGRVLRVREPTEEAVRAAFTAARGGRAIIRFETAGPIAIRRHLPKLQGDFVTVEGNGATLQAADGAVANLIEVNGHDVIVRNIRLRNGADNLRAQGAGAYNVVFSHVSSTGASDDGISIAYGARDVTVQWCFLAGNTRSIFLKYRDTTNVSIHHTWVMKQWARGPLVSGNVLADLRNLIVDDWTMWGTRFEAQSSGNVVHSLFTLGDWARARGGKPGSALRLLQSGPVFTAGNSYAGRAASGHEGTAAAPIAAPPVDTQPVAEMAPRVRARAGCLPRDRIDRAYVERRDGWDVTGSRALRLGPGS